MIDVNDCRERDSRRTQFYLCRRFFGSRDSRPTGCVGPHGAQWGQQLAGDVRSIQVGSERPKDVLGLLLDTGSAEPELAAAYRQGRVWADGVHHGALHTSLIDSAT